MSKKNNNPQDLVVDTQSSNDLLSKRFSTVALEKLSKLGISHEKMLELADKEDVRVAGVIIKTHNPDHWAAKREADIADVDHKILIQDATRDRRMAAAQRESAAKMVTKARAQLSLSAADRAEIQRAKEQDKPKKALSFKDLQKAFGKLTPEQQADFFRAAEVARDLAAIRILLADSSDETDEITKVN